MPKPAASLRTECFIDNDLLRAATLLEVEPERGGSRCRALRGRGCVVPPDGRRACDYRCCERFRQLPRQGQRPRLSHCCAYRSLDRPCTDCVLPASCCLVRRMDRTAPANVASNAILATLMLLLKRGIHEEFSDLVSGDYHCNARIPIAAP